MAGWRHEPFVSERPDTWQLSAPVVLGRSAGLFRPWLDVMNRAVSSRPNGLRPDRIQVNEDHPGKFDFAPRDFSEFETWPAMQGGSEVRQEDYHIKRDMDALGGRVGWFGWHRADEQACLSYVMLSGQALRVGLMIHLQAVEAGSIKLVSILDIWDQEVVSLWFDPESGSLKLRWRGGQELCVQIAEGIRWQWVRFGVDTDDGGFMLSINGLPFVYEAYTGIAPLSRRMHIGVLPGSIGDEAGQWSLALGMVGNEAYAMPGISEDLGSFHGAFSGWCLWDS